MRASLFSNRLLFSLSVGVLALSWWYFGPATSKPIPVGVLHSFTGPMAASERAVADATLLAIEEVNASKRVVLGSNLGIPMQESLPFYELGWLDERQGRFSPPGGRRSIFQSKNDPETGLGG